MSEIDFNWSSQSHDGSFRAKPGSGPRLRSLIIAVLSTGLFLSVAMPAIGQHYRQTNLVSDVPGLAPTTDPNLVNPWGLTSSSTSPWWVADNGTGVSTLYNGAGQKLALTVTIPPAAPPSTPTGVVFNGNSSEFGASRFIFVTEDGTIAGWTAGPTAVIKFTSPTKAVYKGATIAKANGTDFLYVANFYNGTVDVFDTNFAPTFVPPGAFTDPTIPSGFAPFNVQELNGNLFVAFAMQDEEKEDEVAGRGLGYADIFDPNGTLLLRLRPGKWMDAPWGVALAPDGFGKLSGRLLVGMFGSGEIATFDLDHGNYHGMMMGVHGQKLQIDGLWAIRFGNDQNAGPSTTLFFTAGIQDEAHGLFGTITPLEPGEESDGAGHEMLGNQNRVQRSGESEDKVSPSRGGALRLVLKPKDY